MADRTKITEVRARAFASADGRDALLRDSAAPGLGLRVRPNGHKAWIVHRRCNVSVIGRTLGTLDALTAEDARHAARVPTGDTATGAAPVAIPTVWTFAPEFLADCAERWKPGTRRAHADGMNRYILPAFGKRRVDAVTAKDVRNWFDDLSAMRVGTANQALAVLSSMMKHAEALDLRREDSNPCRGLRRRKTGFEVHYLTDDELAALGRALDGTETITPSPSPLCASFSTLAPASRKALRCRWEHKHLDRYVTELAERHNNRPYDTFDMMGRIAEGMARQRLRYEDLTEKAA